MHDSYTEEAMALEARREYDERWAPVATLSDAHSHWHAQHGANAVCPLDCGASEGVMAEYDELDDDEVEPRVTCGHCKAKHTVAGVRLCAEMGYAKERDRC